MILYNSEKQRCFWIFATCARLSNTAVVPSQNRAQKVIPCLACVRSTSNKIWGGICSTSNGVQKYHPKLNIYPRTKCDWHNKKRDVVLTRRASGVTTDQTPPRSLGPAWATPPGFAFLLGLRYSQGTPGQWTQDLILTASRNGTHALCHIKPSKVWIVSSTGAFLV